MRLGLGLGLNRVQQSQKGKPVIKYLFIDGGCLRATLKKVSERYFDGRDLRINFAQLKSDHVKAFYYDAIPAIKNAGSEADYQERIRPRIDLHNQIARLPGYHIYEGDSRIRRKQVQQKEVDVMIAVDMLMHTFRGNMDRATFIASDIDFKPLLDALVREGMFVNLLYPPSDTNQDLVNAADQRTPLAIDTLYGFLDKECQDSLVLPSRGERRKSSLQASYENLLLQHGMLGQVWYDIIEDQHTIYWHSPVNLNNLSIVQSPDYGMLRKYVEDVFVMQIPENAPKS